LSEGVRAIAHELTGQWPARLPAVAPSSTTIPGWLGVVGIIAGLIGVSASSVLAVRTLRATGWLATPLRCEQCRKTLQQVTVAHKQAYLNAGQLQEERLKTAYYETWQCPKCQTIQLNRVPQTRVDSERCPQCSYQTVIVETHTLRESTYQATGRREVMKYCYNCQHQNTAVTTSFQILPEEPPKPADDTDPLAWLRDDSVDAVSDTTSHRRKRARRGGIFTGHGGDRSGGGGATGSW